MLVLHFLQDVHLIMLLPITHQTEEIKPESVMMMFAKLISGLILMVGSSTQPSQWHSTLCTIRY